MIDPKQQRVLEEGTASEEDLPRDVSPESRPRAGDPEVGGHASGRTRGHPESAPSPRPQGKGG
ncbi:MAG TPA: hypothetical protein VFM93_08190 [Candidatus Limnocylindria bacterium]|nr:hypothetical protein [Candidatus Limnocylindria bacterium]